jgi:hypothetical protein
MDGCVEPWTKELILCDGGHTGFFFPLRKDEGDPDFHKNSYLVFFSLTDPNWI